MLSAIATVLLQKAIFQDRIAFPDFEYKHTKTGLKIDKGDRNLLVLAQRGFVHKSNITFYGSVHANSVLLSLSSWSEWICDVGRSDL